jgi:hypothetical protein
MAQHGQLVSCVLEENGTVSMRFPHERTRVVSAQTVCRSTVVAGIVDLEGVDDAKICAPAPVVCAWLDCVDSARGQGLRSVPFATLVDYLKVT